MKSKSNSSLTSVCKKAKPKIILLALPFFILLGLNACSNSSEHAEEVNTPTAGNLKIYYDEGMALHLKNQIFTFEALYPNAHLQSFQSSEDEAVQALYHDSCEAIMISRPLHSKELKAFESKGFFPKYSTVAKSGLALITNTQTNLLQLNFDQIKTLLAESYSIKDSSGKEHTLKVLFDKNSSSVLHYVIDSLLNGKGPGPQCNILTSTQACINYIATTPNTIGFIDFAWLSDVDDSIYKANKDKLRFIAVSSQNHKNLELPSPSSFKLGTYPFTRGVYIYRKTGDFTLAKGFESFVAGPKGQLTFLKQGLLPTHQNERSVHITTEK